MNLSKINNTFKRMYNNPTYRFWVVITGLFTMIPVFLNYLSKKKDDDFKKLFEETKSDLEKSGLKEELYAQAMLHITNKSKYFNKNLSDSEKKAEAEKIVSKNFNSIACDTATLKAKEQNIYDTTVVRSYEILMNNPVFAMFSFVFSFPLYILMLIFANPVSKYILDRLFMMIFVILGVTFLVFTILYISPMDPAVNSLGQTATDVQIAQFNRMHGLDKSYIEQLFNSFKNLITFDLGNSYQGNDNISIAIANKFPTTMEVAFWAVLVSVAIAIPAGIISAIKQYSSFDYIFMFFALLGLSIPNFWLGLIFILKFSIELGILPATFNVNNALTLIMPSIVLGTGLSASVARMTRSSMLEVKNSDYILTARAKGLSEHKVVLKHILGNAMIPIITIVGMQFGGMLGGSSVTEKVFNINGLGSWIVDKQFIPDIPVVLAGVVYISIVISIVNLIVDILYSCIDPRIKSKMKNY